MNKGERIKKLREAKGITQEELAKLLNTTKQTVSKYEKDIVTNIPSDRIELLSHILDTTPSYIMGWDQDQIDVVAETQIEANEYSNEMEKDILSFREEFAEAHFSPAEIYQLKMFMRSMKNNAEVKIDLGAAIKEARESKGMTKEELAAMLEVPVEMIDLYEGSMSFPYDQMKKLNSILGISFYTMLGIPQKDASLYEKIYFLHLTEDEMKEVYEYAKYIQSKRK